MTEISLAIIGTAGRGDDARKLDKNSFKAMCIVAEGLLEQLSKSNYAVTHLVSGGAAWADHVAVRLFLDKKVKNLRLFLPCQFSDGAFVDQINPRTPMRFSPAERLNTLHTKFSRALRIHSITEISSAKNEGAEIFPCRGGFYGRNAMVAKSDILLAMTFGEGKMVKEGGTADTVRRYLDRVEKEGFFNKSFHYNLSDGQIYKDIEAPPDPSKIKKK